MPFDATTAVEYVSDSRYDLAKKPLKVDKDNRAYELSLIPPATGKGTWVKSIPGNATTVDFNESCFNADGSMQYIDLHLGSDYKLNPMGTYIVVKYVCKQARALNVNLAGNGSFKGAPYTPTAQVGHSIPWTPTWFFNTVSLKLNNTQTPCEQYISSGTLHHIVTARILQKFKRDALESDELQFMTPCLETSLDTNVVLSVESDKRAKNWMGCKGAIASTSVDASSTVTTEYTKLIPLSTIFECCGSPAIWNNVSKLRFEYTFKTPDQICFDGSNRTALPAAGATTSQVFCFVTDVRLLHDSTRMAPVLAIETASEKQQGFVEMLPYLENFVIPQSYSQNQQLVLTNQRDVQQVILGFPVIGVNTNKNVVIANRVTYVNPLQYFNGNMKELSIQYGSDMPLRFPLSLGGIDASQAGNALGFTLYRKACGADLASTVPLALSFKSTYPWYSLFWLPIYSPNLAKRNSDAKDIRINTSQEDLGNVGPESGPDANTCTSTLNAIVIARKLQLVQVSSDGIVEKMS